MKCPSRTYFMHTLLQLIPSKAAVFFISDENLGWLPITLLLIISFSFDLHYDCSVRRTHLFISFARRDGLFWRLHRLLHMKNVFGSRRDSLCKCTHGCCIYFVCLQALDLQLPTVGGTNYCTVYFSPPIFGGCCFFCLKITHTLPLKALIC